jgi:hypothetical protein
MTDLRPKAEVLHADCCVCQAAVTCETPEEATLVLLVAMLIEDGMGAHEWHRELCFYHRRQVDCSVRADPGDAAG